MSLFLRLQLLDMVPGLDGGDNEDDDGLQGLAIDLVRCLGSHSINVAQLKKIFRLMQPLPPPPRPDEEKEGDVKMRPRPETAPLQSPWLCCLLRALLGMMDDHPGPQRFFLLDGITSGLRLPRMPRWPARKGYTFCAWVRLEPGLASRVFNFGGGAKKNSPSAGAPCLFSFCGERGQGVAACFIPLRMGRTKGRSKTIPAGTAASKPSKLTDTMPQQYALELRVGKGRKRSPVYVRFPGTFVTAGEWVFVAVAHAPSSWGHNSEAAVLLGNDWRSEASPFPRFKDGGVASASIACHCPLESLVSERHLVDTEGAGAKIPGRPVLCNLRGQVII